jgi:hypothetical protein
MAPDARSCERRARRAALKGALGSTSTSLVGYGVSARKTPTALTSEQQVARAAATRKARGALGKKQKSLIKGTVPAAPAEPPAATPAGTPKGP